MIHKTSLISGVSGLYVMGQIPTPQVDTHIDLILKTIVAVASLIPTILNIFKRRPKAESPKLDETKQNSDSTLKK